MRSVNNLNSVKTILLLLGIFANYLFNKFTIRGVAYIGGFVFFVGSLLTPFVTTLNQLILAYGLLEGTLKYCLKLYDKIMQKKGLDSA